jgi:hypothetical protein
MWVGAFSIDSRLLFPYLSPMSKQKDPQTMLEKLGTTQLNEMQIAAHKAITQREGRASISRSQESKDRGDFGNHQDLTAYNVPLSSCSRSMASNKALKLPLPKERAPSR